MVKSSLNLKEHKPSSSSELRVTEASSSSCKYTGVRKRKWGKYVSEIRLSNSRERIWLGSYDTAEKAARAFDAAQFCLRGGNAKFNFPDNPPEIANGRSMTPAEIQIAAARFAHLESDTRVENLYSQSDSLSSRADSPCPSVSGEAGQVDSECTDIPLDNVFLDQFLNLDTESNINDFRLFPGFDDFPGDFFAPPVSPSFDYWQNNNEDSSPHGSFIWNF